MYIRFESNVRDNDARCNQGIFCATFDALNELSEACHSWQVAEIHDVIDWFNENLAAPEHVSYRPNQKAAINGICWFRSSATVFVSQARYLAWLLGDLGNPILERHERRPGRILWEDPYQVVASAYL